MERERPFEATARDRQLLQLVAERKSPQEVAAAMGIAKRTYDGYVGELIRASGQRNLLEVVLLALELGVVSLPEIDVTEPAQTIDAQPIRTHRHGVEPPQMHSA